MTCSAIDSCDTCKTGSKDANNECFEDIPVSRPSVQLESDGQSMRVTYPEAGYWIGYTSDFTDPNEVVRTCFDGITAQSEWDGMSAAQFANMKSHIDAVVNPEQLSYLSTLQTDLGQTESAFYLNLYSRATSLYGVDRSSNTAHVSDLQKDNYVITNVGTIPVTPPQSLCSLILNDPNDANHKSLD